MREAGPGIVQRAKKRANRFLLDNKQSQCVVLFLIVIGLSSIFLLSTLGYLRDKNGIIYQKIPEKIAINHQTIYINYEK